MSYFDVMDGKAASESGSTQYQAFRLDGLADIRSEYGVDSHQYRHAKDALRSVLSAAYKKLQKTDVHFAFLTLPHQEGQKLEKRGDPLFPFRSSLGSTPFLRSRDFPVASESSGPSSVPSQLPKEKDYLGKCFTSEEDLLKATLNCSNRGQALLSSKGGRKCFRCKCQQSKAKNGKLTYWVC